MFTRDEATWYFQIDLLGNATASPADLSKSETAKALEWSKHNCQFVPRSG
jgi:hypothetical protein